jgi:hypothetical protein
MNHTMAPINARPRIGPMTTPAIQAFEAFGAGSPVDVGCPVADELSMMCVLQPRRSIVYVHCEPPVRVESILR